MHLKVCLSALIVLLILNNNSEACLKNGLVVISEEPKLDFSILGLQMEFISKDEMGFPEAYMPEINDEPRAPTKHEELMDLMDLIN